MYYEHQVCEHPDSTISKESTILKWRTITMLNRKLLEKQRLQNCFASYELHIGHLFTMSMSVLFNPVCIDLKILLTN